MPLNKKCPEILFVEQIIILSQKEIYFLKCISFIFRIINFRIKNSFEKLKLEELAAFGLAESESIGFGFVDPLGL